MKLRIHADSIRLRVTQSEAATLGAGGRLENWIQFTPAADDRLGYAIDVSNEASEIHASCAQRLIQITLPAILAHEWANSAQVGLEHVQSVTDHSGLRIILEKDFRCLHPRMDENESDNFPHPVL